MIFETALHNEFFYAGIILLSAIILARIILFIFSKAVQRTKITSDDNLYRNIKTPFFVILVSFGLYASSKFISLLDIYRGIINNAFLVWFVLLGSLFIVRFFNGLTESYFAGVKDGTRKSKLDRTAAPFIERIIAIVVYIMAGLMLLRMFNIEITPILASLGIASLAVALALQDTLANFFASIYIVTERPINVGNYVKLESGEEGYVENISWRNSTIKMLQGNRIVVPNSKLSKMTITNYYYPTKDMAVLVQCGVAYGSDLKKVEKVTVETAKKVLQTVEGGFKDFEPFIRYHTFAESNIEFTIILRVNEYVDQYLVKHEFVKELTEAYKKNNIEISFPARNVYMRK